MGQFTGHSLAKGQIDDVLNYHKDALTVVTATESDWGEAIFTPGVRAFAYRKVGTGLNHYAATSQSSGQFIDHTPYGTTVGGVVDLDTSQRKELVEVRGTLRIVGPGVVMLRTSRGSALRNLETGAELSLPDDAKAILSPQGLIVYQGADSPTKASLYSLKDWKLVSTWN
jgi:hypothetical protein